MNRDLIIKNIKSLKIAEQLSISIEILENVILNSNPNEKLILNEIKQIQKLISGN